MDLMAALALVFMIEGLALAIFAGSLPELVASLSGLGERHMRTAGIAAAAAGAALYLLIRG